MKLLRSALPLLLVVLAPWPVAASDPLELRSARWLRFAPGTTHQPSGVAAPPSAIDIRTVPRGVIPVALRGSEAALAVVPRQSRRRVARLELRGGDGRRIDGDGEMVLGVPFGLGSDLPPNLSGIRLPAGQPPGMYEVDLSKDRSGSPEFHLVIRDGAPWVLEARMTRMHYALGEPPIVEARLLHLDTGEVLKEARMTAASRPRGTRGGRVALRDDGREGDAVAGDGWFSATLVGPRSGNQQEVDVDLVAEAMVDNLPLRRVSQTGYFTASGHVRVRGSDPAYLDPTAGIVVPVRLEGRRRGTYRIQATLVGTREGETLRVAYTEGELTVPTGSSLVHLSFQAADVLATEAVPPFRLVDMVVIDDHRDFVADDVGDVGPVEGFTRADLEALPVPSPSPTLILAP